MKLSKEALLCFVGIFQKGIFGVADASELMKNMEFTLNKDNELTVENPNQYQMSESDIELIKVSALTRNDA